MINIVAATEGRNMNARTCERCGGKIPKVRLEALPETRTCVGCSCERVRTVLDIEVDGPDEQDLRSAVTGVDR